MKEAESLQKEQSPTSRKIKKATQAGIFSLVSLMNFTRASLMLKRLPLMQKLLTKIILVLYTFIIGIVFFKPFVFFEKESSEKNSLTSEKRSGLWAI